jgi:hypothetical protein
MRRRIGSPSRSEDRDDGDSTADFWFDDGTDGACVFSISAECEVSVISSDSYGGRPDLIGDLERTWADNPDMRDRFLSALRALDLAG